MTDDPGATAEALERARQFLADLNALCSLHGVSLHEAAEQDEGSIVIHDQRTVEAAAVPVHPLGDWLLEVAWDGGPRRFHVTDENRVRPA